MENLDVLVLRQLRDWRQAGQQAMLATVVKTWGSSPRPVGSIMALRHDGMLVGSVSGGCIEDDLIHSHVHPPEESGAHEGRNRFLGPPVFVQYGVTADEAHRFGLPCGGTLELLLEYNPDPLSLNNLVAALEQGMLMSRTVTMDGRVHLERAANPAELVKSPHQVVNTFGPEYRMLLIGAGQLSEYLATMAAFSGFAVTLCDPRESYGHAPTLPGVKISRGMPDDVVLQFKPDRRSCIVALTHDPKLDDLALLEALGTDAFYVGAIGSRLNNRKRRQRLQEHFDMPAETLAKLRGPVGLFIGSKTPAEIAVSVMAEIIAVKNGVALHQACDVAEGKAAREVAWL
ncbi:XdhC family protein [Comamonas testosteroni]|uniref:XdhC family protein n=1 Tax=Comamonas testosteroni TaxID=285 RepID=UPI0006B990A5|nr:XdhC family protein [Comamonas testosteroni]